MPLRPFCRSAPLPLLLFWVTQSPAPERRAHHALEYDPVRERVLLTGGSSPREGGTRFEMFGDLWGFDGKAWALLPATAEPMSGMRLAWDSRRRRMLSFGGYDRRARGDLRVLEDSAWRLLGRHPEVAAAEPGFVYDSLADRFVQFGGSSGPGQPNGETWSYDGKEWRKLAEPNPPARQAHVMVYDAKRGRVMLFGGMASGPRGQPPPSLGDTWELEGERWVQREVPGPSPRSGSGATWDSRRGQVILFGGVGPDGFHGDTWAWDGSAWRKLADTGPEPRGMGYLAYDVARDRVVLFGGRKGWPDGDLDDTWEWDGTAWQKIR